MAKSVTYNKRTSIWSESSVEPGGDYYLLQKIIQKKKSLPKPHGSVFVERRGKRSCTSFQDIAKFMEILHTNMTT